MGFAKTLHKLFGGITDICIKSPPFLQTCKNAHLTDGQFYGQLISVGLFFHGK